MTVPDEPVDWDDLVQKLTGGEVEDPRNPAEKKSLTERVQQPHKESVAFQRLTRFVINVGRTVATALYIAAGGLGLMWANQSLASTFPGMPPGASFWSATIFFGGIALAWSIFRRLTQK